ncbi:LPXTG cell wall anchor domain-containing protein, partial [Bacillus sp. Au-Bac7]|uniref:LPXTG cell wall anchor domain-containing protein n=1 Tax=Bacillus sp. Au-Bac7 TaxID=2906458 RepID=UPI001E58DDC5
PSDGDNGETPGDTDPSDGDNGETPGDTDPSDGDNGETPGDNSSDGDVDETPVNADPSHGNNGAAPPAANPSNNNSNISGSTTTSGNVKTDTDNHKGSNSQYVRSANDNSDNSWLPNTATSNYTILLIGAALAATGIVIYAHIRRRAKIVQNR